MQDTVFNETLVRSVNICVAFPVIKKVKVHTRWSTQRPVSYNAGNNLVLLVQEAAWAPGWSGRVQRNLVPYRIRSPVYLVCGKLLYWLHYSGSLSQVLSHNEIS